jgi:hypothetical protein
MVSTARLARLQREAHLGSWYAQGSKSQFGSDPTLAGHDGILEVAGSQTTIGAREDWRFLEGAKIDALAPTNRGPAPELHAGGNYPFGFNHTRSPVLLMRC